MSVWRSLRGELKPRVRSILRPLTESLDGDWSVYPESTAHWVAVYLVKDTGSLAKAMNRDDMAGVWAWIGLGLEGKNLASGIDVGGDPKYFTPLVRGFLKAAGLKEPNRSQAQASGAREFYASSRVDAATLKSNLGLKRALQGRVALAQRIVECIDTNFKSAGNTVLS